MPKLTDELNFFFIVIQEKLWYKHTQNFLKPASRFKKFTKKADNFEEKQFKTTSTNSVYFILI